MASSRLTRRRGGRLQHHYGRFMRHTRGKKCPCFTVKRKATKIKRRH